MTKESIEDAAEKYTDMHPLLSVRLIESINELVRAAYIAGAKSIESSALEVLLEINTELDKFWNGDKSDKQIKKICQIQQKCLGIIKKTNN